MVKWNAPESNDVWTIPFQWLSPARKLKINPAVTGFASLPSQVRSWPPPPKIRRASHSGVAWRKKIGMKNVMSMCCTMCNEYKYCSAMSCSGQSAAK